MKTRAERIVRDYCFPDEGSLICPPGKSMIFLQKGNGKIEIVTRPDINSSQQQLQSGNALDDKSTTGQKLQRTPQNIKAAIVRLIESGELLPLTLLVLIKTEMWFNL